jgi:tetratricopeptide (TPR) repeat protein
LIPNYMQCAPPGEGSRSFPSFFLLILLLILGLGSALFPPESAGQKSEGEGLSRFDRLAEEATQLNKREKYDEVISLLEPHKGDPKNESTLFFNELGIAYRNKGRLNETLQAYQRAYALEPQNPEITPVILNNLGYTYFLKKDYPKAIDHYEKAINLAYRFKEAHSNLSLAFYELKKYEEALKEIDVVLKLDPNHEAARKFRDRIRKKMQEKK